eukprot:SM000076S21818  [mRNA]  locus=s76:318050:319109:- [translate_table: standard]
MIQQFKGFTFAFGPQHPAAHRILLLALEMNGENLKLEYFIEQKDQIIDHLSALTTHAMLIGAIPPILWAFEEQEKLLRESQEQECMLVYTWRHVDEQVRLMKNRSGKQRVVDISVVTAQQAVIRGFGGGTSFNCFKNLTISSHYDAYAKVDFDLPVGTRGDSHDRHCVHVEKIRQITKPNVPTDIKFVLLVLLT